MNHLQQRKKNGRKILNTLFLIELIVLVVAVVLFFFIDAAFRPYYMALVGILLLNVIFLYYFIRRNFKR